MAVRARTTPDGAHAVAVEMASPHPQYQGPSDPTRAAFCAPHGALTLRRSHGRWQGPHGTRGTVALCAALTLALQCTGCTRSSGRMELLAAFSDDTVVGELSATWTDATAADRSAPPGRQVHVRVQGVNRLADRLYVELREFRLVTADGNAVVVGNAACALAPQASGVVLEGEAWLTGSANNSVRGFRVDPLAVPLSDRGVAFYREFLLAQRPGAEADIDRVLAAYAAAPRCRAAE
jgi:hypothetical protein